jgi:hypothetical protein
LLAEYIETERAGLTMRLVQLKKGNERRVAIVEEPRLRLLEGARSIYELAHAASSRGSDLSGAAKSQATGESLNYDEVHAGRSEWRLHLPFDHPEESARCMVSGTGLTHLGSAQGRDAMHVTAKAGAASAAVSEQGAVAVEQMTDSMKMFRWGLMEGRPEAGQIGIAPEWFYKGTGAALRSHGEELEIPAYAEDGGEEAEVAGVYLIGDDGRPRRIGFAVGNEFSDHQFEKRNYLNLAGSKLRTCGLGPELVIDPEFRDVAVEASIERGGKVIWSKSFRSGEEAMCHSLQNIEHHHFKFDSHRRPGDVHVHFFGTAALSFGDGVKLLDSDVMQVAVEGFGRALRNPVRVAGTPQDLVSTIPMK